MNEKRINELMEKESKLASNKTKSDKELQNIRHSLREKEIEKNNWSDEKFHLCDLSGGFWGI